MKLDCQISEVIQKDFNALWKCRQLGETVEISTPYLYPNSTLVSVFLTQRNERYIVCEGGSVNELLTEYAPLPDDELKQALDGIAAKFRMRKGQLDGEPLFFKESTDIKIVSSMVFDVANFATMAASALISAGGNEVPEVAQTRFEARAESFLKAIKPPSLVFKPTREIREVPGFRFSAVLGNNSRLWLVSYVTGSNATYFRRSVCDTALSFKHVWRSGLSPMIRRTIPVVNTEAEGYQPNRLQWQLEELAKESHGSTVLWSEKESLSEMLS